MQLDQLKRRDFITLLGGAAVRPIVAHGQQPAVSVIGFLSPGSPQDDALRLSAVQRGLKEIGYADGQNVAIEYRWARSNYD